MNCWFTISVLANAVRRRVRNEHDHLARVRSPLHGKCLGKCGGDRFGTIATAGSVEAREILVDLRNIGRETKVPRDVCVILRRMVAVRDEADPEILSGLQLAGLIDVVADLLNVLRRRGNVAALASRAILHEDEITATNQTLVIAGHTNAETGRGARFWACSAGEIDPG